MENSHDNMILTSAEMGKLWTTYTGNTLAKCVVKYFLQHVNDPDIKNTLESAQNLVHTVLGEIKEIFIKANFPTPIGYTEEDVNIEAPRLFFDEFYLHYLKYTAKAGMSIYSIAIPIMTRKDTRDFFIRTLNATVNLITDVNELLINKGLYIKPPLIPTPDKVDFIKKQNYLNGFFGNVRALHALEIAHLYDITENNLTSKALLIGFSQVAENNSVSEFFMRGKDLTSKHIDISSQQLHKENLPSAILLDDLVTKSNISPFSDKLMLSHKIEMFSMKIRTIGNAISLNGRRDLAALYAKILTDVELYVEDGANIMIEQGWMEQPPKAIDRNELAKE